MILMTAVAATHESGFPTEGACVRAPDPVHRGRGVAKALIAEAERILRKHGVRIFCALIEDYNTVPRKLFKECGYVEHSDIKYFSKRDSLDRSA